MIKNTIREAKIIFDSFDKNNIMDFELINILEKEDPDEKDFLSLIYSDNDYILEKMAQKSKKITESYFGKNIMLYAPLYISNHCRNGCIYCGFSLINNKMERKSLSYIEIEKEAKILKEKGFNSIILLTGEDKKESTVEYIAKAVKICRKYFSEIIIEVYPMDHDEYKEIYDAGAIGLNLYQETYNENIYHTVHLFGKKRDYEYRLEAVERAIKAGFKEINIGALLGLGNPYEDAFMSIIHGRHLLKKYPEIELSISFPRLCHASDSFDLIPTYPVNDKEFIKFMLTTRLIIKNAGINISTRERKFIRDNIIGLGVTKMSAGSKTSVGGYSEETSNSDQFTIEDTRCLDEIVSLIKDKGYRPEFTNWVNYV